MASTNQSIDELITVLIGMGFDFDDCQQAVSAGKLSVESAIDWILSGKPDQGNASASGTLRLASPSSTGLGVSSFPTSAEPTTPPPLSPNHDTASTSEAGVSDDQKVVSRSHLNDEQRKIRDRFEEKQREEATRTAKAERLAKKRAHEAALKQIQEDRELFKMKMSGSGARPKDLPCTEKDPASSSDSCSRADKAKTSLLQIRLPHGHPLKHTFSASDDLQRVWNFVKDHYANCDSMQLIQPFPRIEFTSEHMTKSLSELGLVPTGSLVLKKVEEQTVHAPDPHSGSPEAVFEKPSLPTPPSEEEPVSPPHNWGAGVKLEDANPPHNDAGDEPMQEEENPAEDEPEIVPNPLPWPPPNAIAGHNHPHHAWGEGERLMGEVINPERFPHHSRDPKALAAEKASERYAHSSRVSPDHAPEAAALALQEVQALSHLVIQHLSMRLCDPRHPIISLHGLPAQVADSLLQHLLKEKLLRPRTLHPFLSCHLHTIVLDFYSYATNELLHELRLHTCVTHLSLRACSLITDKGLQDLSSLKRLKTLNLGSCPQLTDNCLPVVKELPNLQVLILDGTGITDEGLQIIFNRPPQNLHSLDVSRTAVSHKIFSIVFGAPKLCNLNLELTKVCSLSGVQNLRSLHSLNLSGTSIVTDSLLCLNQSTLRALNVSNTLQVDGDLGLEYLKGMPLVALDLTNYINVSNEGMEHIGKIHSLKRLSLSNTKITDIGLIFLKGLTNLEELALDRTSVTDEGACVIQAFTKLHELSLSETGITNAFLMSKIIENCFMLSKLNLSKTSISDKGVLCLKQPNLVLLNLDSTRVHPEISKFITRNCPMLERITTANVTPINDDEEET